MAQLYEALDAVDAQPNGTAVLNELQLIGVPLQTQPCEQSKAWNMSTLITEESSEHIHSTTKGKWQWGESDHPKDHTQSSNSLPVSISTWESLGINSTWQSGESANAVPHYQKWCSRDSHIWGIRRGQHNRSAMAEPRSGWTTFLIAVSPLPGKYELDETETGGPFLDTALQFMVHRWFSVFDVNLGKKFLLLRKQTQPCNHLKARSRGPPVHGRFRSYRSDGVSVWLETALSASVQSPDPIGPYHITHNAKLQPSQPQPHQKANNLTTKALGNVRTVSARWPWAREYMRQVQKKKICNCTVTENDHRLRYFK